MTEKVQISPLTEAFFESKLQEYNAFIDKIQPYISDKLEKRTLENPFTHWSVINPTSEDK